MANPFLMEDPVDYGDSSVPSNPFLFSSEEVSYPVQDNPFLNFTADVPTVPDNVGTNPFADYSWEEPNQAHLLTTTNINDPENDFVVSSDEEASKPKRPPPPPRPSMPKETQDLILSVQGALKATSDHLLDRIPPTRAPSPTVLADLHSPSPTPDLLGGEDDLLSLSQQTAPTKPPPPRPAPPPAPVRPNVPPTQSEEFDLFGTAIPPTPKSKDAILNLYTQPKQPVDLLSEDITIPLQTPLITAEPQVESLIECPQPTPPPVTEVEEIPSPPKREPVEIPVPKVIPPPPRPAPPSSSYLEENMKPDPEKILAAAASIPHEEETIQEPTGSIFGTGPDPVEQPVEIFGTVPKTESVFGGVEDAFDAFAAKFDRTEVHAGGSDAFGPPSGRQGVSDVWGSAGSVSVDQTGFGGEESFDAFLSMSQPPPPPQSTPSHFSRNDSLESEEGGFNVFIKPKDGETYPQTGLEAVPSLAPPPPKSPALSTYSDSEGTFNPFDKDGHIPAFPVGQGFQLPPLNQNEPYEGGFKRSESQETPPTPLFDEDVSQPLENFPRTTWAGDGWDMQLRHPNKKKITGQRFWKKIFVRLVYQGDNPIIQLFNLKDDKDPFQELPLQACYSISEISAQQYDQFGKIFTVKLQYIFYKERPGVRPGQVTKAERITNKLSQFAAYAIQGDYQGVKEFGSDLKKLGLPVEHAPQISELLKLGCMSFEDLKQFSVTIEECLFRMSVHRDRALNYKMEEVQITVVDEIYVEQDAYGHVEKQIARVRLFFLAFLSGMPNVELGVNDIWRQGKEVVGRHDIIPVATEEWIRLEDVHFHSCVQLDEYEKTRLIIFKPPDACYIELMRFRIRPPKNRELPLQLKAVMCVTGNKVELRADVLVPGFTSRKLGQIPCEDVMIRIPIPECWIYLFRVEKHFRYGSVKSAHRRTGKIKGIERFLGAVDTLEPSLMEVTSGQAKYEHQHRSIVWRMPRLPKEGQGAYTTHNLVCKLQLTSFDQIPENLAEFCAFAYVEFTMPATTASHTTVRSVSLVDSPSDNPPEKYVRQLARMEYRVGIEHTQGEEAAAYVTATATKPKAADITPSPVMPHPDSDSDSSD